MLASPEPDLEQAKQTFKLEMANSKVKKEVKMLREERDGLQNQLREREERIVVLERELSKWRGPGTAGTGTAGKSSSGGRSLISSLFILIVIAVLFLVVVYKVLGYDVLAAVAPEWSMEELEAKGMQWIGKKLK
jgi:hypothetical protein